MQDRQTKSERQVRPEISSPRDSSVAGEVSESWKGEFQQTLKLAIPLVLAQLAQFSLQITDVVMMGWLGRDTLAAGSLAAALLHPLTIFGIGALTAVTPMVAQAIGAKDYVSVRRSARQGIWVSILVAIIVMLVLYRAESIYLLAGQAEETAALAASYLNYAALGVMPALGFTALRGFVTAHSQTRIILVTTIASFFINLAGNYTLMFGHFGFPKMGLAGAGIATSTVQAFVFLVLLGYIARHQAYRKYDLFVRFWKPDWPRFIEMLKIGIPIGLMLTVEVGFFAGSTFLMGWLGNDALAAHTIASQCASFSFMVPLGLSQAATIRTGLAFGRRSKEGIRRAGWMSAIIAAGFNAISCLVLLLFPHFFIGLYLDASDPVNAVSFSLGVGFLVYAGLFQVVDGLQAVMAGALRGLSDTKIPMVIATIGYWVFGMTTSYLFGFTFGWQGDGIWLGLAVGLMVTASALTFRFVWRERLGLLKMAH